jgi:hypothetical protein
MSTTHFDQRLAKALHMALALNRATFKSSYQAMAIAECEKSVEIDTLFNEASEWLWE